MDTAKSMLALLLGRTWPLFPVFHQFLEVNPLLSHISVSKPKYIGIMYSTSAGKLTGDLPLLTTKQVCNCLSPFLTPPHLLSLLPSHLSLQQQSKYKGMNKDQWYNVLEFSRTINADLSNYDEDGACEYKCKSLTSAGPPLQLLETKMTFSKSLLFQLHKQFELHFFNF